MKSSVCLLIFGPCCLIRSASSIAKSCLLCFCCQYCHVWEHLGSCNVAVVDLLVMFLDRCVLLESIFDRCAGVSNIHWLGSSTLPLIACTYTDTLRWMADRVCLGYFWWIGFPLSGFCNRCWTSVLLHWLFRCCYWLSLSVLFLLVCSCWSFGSGSKIQLGCFVVRCSPCLFCFEREVCCPVSCW